MFELSFFSWVFEFLWGSRWGPPLCEHGFKNGSALVSADLPPPLPITIEESGEFGLCLGVRGTTSISGSPSGYEEVLSELDSLQQGCGVCASSPSRYLPSMDITGNCKHSVAGSKVGAMEGWLVSNETFENLGSIDSYFECLEKKWGGTGTRWNNGVSCKHVNVGKAVDRGKEVNVAELLVTGDLYSGHVRGVAPVPGVKTAPCGEGGCGGVYCQEFVEIPDGRRVGSVLVSRTLVGPGRLRVRARVPRASPLDELTGYSFGVWTLYASEVYRSSEAGSSFQSLVHDGLMVNHEIDIEVPGSWPEGARGGSSTRARGWSSMNLCTWLGDNGGGRWDALHQQVLAVTEGSFVSEAGEFHDYEFDWFVDPSSPQFNFVDFFFDGRFVFRSRDFVPVRPGKLYIGPWSASWALQNGAPFDKVVVQVSEIEYKPQQGLQPAFYPQTFDQDFQGFPLHCGLHSLV